MENTEIKFYYQRNLENRQKIAETKNKINLKFCSVKTASSIRERVKRSNPSAKETLAKFKSKSGEVTHVTNSMIAKHLQLCAKKPMESNAGEL